MHYELALCIMSASDTRQLCVGYATENRASELKAGFIDSCKPDEYKSSASVRQKKVVFQTSSHDLVKEI